MATVLKVIRVIRVISVIKILKILFTFCLFLFATTSAYALENHSVKIVSLAPSNTELLYSLGAQDSLKGISSYCKGDKPIVGSFVSASFEKLAAIKPDLILLVTGQEVLAYQLQKKNYKVLILPNEKLDDISSNLIKLGQVTGKTAEAKRLSLDFQAHIVRIKKILSKPPTTKTLICVWSEPVICVGRKSFINDLITACGGINVLSGKSWGYSRVSQETLLTSRPDVIILPFEAKGSKIRARLPWSRLCGRIGVSTHYLPQNKSDFLSRPSLHVIDGLYWLAVRLHPSEKEPINKWLDEAKLSLFKVKKDIEDK